MGRGGEEARGRGGEQGTWAIRSPRTRRDAETRAFERPGRRKAGFRARKERECQVYLAFQGKPDFRLWAGRSIARFTLRFEANLDGPRFGGAKVKFAAPGMAREARSPT